MIAAVDAWFDPNVYAWIPGATLGLIGALEGSLAGALAPRGKAKMLVFGVHVCGLLLCLALLVTGIVAKATGQPYGIWYGMGFPGLLGLLLLGSLTPLLIRRYREAELRKSLAEDL